MKQLDRPSILRFTIMLCSITLISGCSGSREDVRITLCKDLTIALTDSDTPVIAWQETETAFRQSAYATVKVRYETAAGLPGNAVCFYAYDVPEENAMTHSRPLTAHSTLPYQMQLNGEPVPEPLLRAAVNAQSRNILMSLFDWFGQGRTNPL